MKAIARRCWSGSAVLSCRIALSLLCSLEPCLVGAEQGPVPTVEVVPVTNQPLSYTIRLPGELRAYQEVDIHAKVQGFVETIAVDRGSFVKKGEVLARLSAPELTAQQRQAEAAARSARAQELEAEAKLHADEDTYRRAKSANDTMPGIVSENYLEVARQAVNGGRARVDALQQSVRAAEEYARALRTTESYLVVTAPFAGVVTERNVHPGALVGSMGAGSALPMFRLQQIDPLRLTIAVPEKDLSASGAGTRIEFTVAAALGHTFSGVLRRIGHAVDVQTRTMPVEVDVGNPGGMLAPGMYAEVTWPVSRGQPSTFVPASAIASTTEKTFVVRIRDGTVEWVDVRKGKSLPGRTEVVGALQPGDLVAVRGTDELRVGTRVNTKAPVPKP